MLHNCAEVVPPESLSSKAVPIQKRFGRSSGLLLNTLSSHASFAMHSDVRNWYPTNELTAAGLRRTRTGFPFHTLERVTKPAAKVQNKIDVAKYF